MKARAARVRADQDEGLAPPDAGARAVGEGTNVGEDEERRHIVERHNEAGQRR